MNKKKISIDSNEFQELIKDMQISKDKQAFILGGAPGAPSCRFDICTKCVGLCASTCAICILGSMK